MFVLTQKKFPRHPSLAELHPFHSGLMLQKLGCQLSLKTSQTRLMAACGMCSASSSLLTRKLQIPSALLNSECRHISLCWYELTSDICKYIRYSCKVKEEVRSCDSLETFWADVHLSVLLYHVLLGKCHVFQIQWIFSFDWQVWELTANRVIMVSAIGNDGPLYGYVNHLNVQTSYILYLYVGCRDTYTTSGLCMQGAVQSYFWSFS